MMRRNSFLVISLLVLVVVAAFAIQASTSSHVEVVKQFTEANRLPEGVALDKAGNMYVTLGPPLFVGSIYGEVRRINKDGTETTIIQYPDGPAPAGLAVDASGTAYFAFPNPGFPNAGVYRVTADDDVEQIPGTEAMIVPNGLAIDKQGNLFASDSILGSIWRLPRGGDTMESWLAHDLLAGCAPPDQVGANGIAFWKDGLYAANTAKGILVYIPILGDGSPGEPEVVAGDPDCVVNDELYGMDGIALDVHGTVYALLVLQEKLVRIDPEDGSVTVLLTVDDGLWNPASVAFGTGKGDRESLYISNYAVIPPEPANSLGAAILKYDVGVPGLPLP